MTEKVALGAKRCVRVQFLKKWVHAVGAGRGEGRRHLEKWVQAEAGSGVSAKGEKCLQKWV